MPRKGGVIIEDGKETGETMMCVHCGKHFMVIKGSGKVRGFCHKCMGPTCGNDPCWNCVPLEARLDYLEGTKTTATVKYLEKCKDLKERGVIL